MTLGQPCRRGFLFAPLSYGQGGGTSGAMRRTNGRREGEVWKGLVAGIAGGLVASWTMNQFQASWGKLSEVSDGTQGGQDSQQSGEESGQAVQNLQPGDDEQ